MAAVVPVVAVLVVRPLPGGAVVAVAARAAVRVAVGAPVAVVILVAVRVVRVVAVALPQLVAVARVTVLAVALPVAPVCGETTSTAEPRGGGKSSTPSDSHIPLYRSENSMFSLA